jgi:hypothetical protein
MRSQAADDPGAVRMRTRLLSVLGLVAVGALAAYLLIGDGKPSSDRPPGDAATSSSASSSPEDVGVLSAEKITQTQPTGRWRAQVIGRSQLLRSGVRTALDYRQQPTTWTFTQDSCSAECTGTVSSSSGQDFAYTWDGRELVVVRRLTDESGKVACFDESGESVPISEGAATHRYRYSFGSFAGSADRLTSRLVIEISTEFSGSCQASPDDALTYVEDQVLTKFPES